MASVLVRRHGFYFVLQPLIEVLDIACHVRNGEPGTDPSRFNAEETQRTLRRQDHLEGEQTGKVVSDFPQGAALGQVLKDLDFSADSGSIVRFLEQSNKPERNEVLPLVQKIEERQYRTSLKWPRQHGWYKANCESKIVDIAF